MAKTKTKKKHKSIRFQAMKTKEQNDLWLGSFF